MIFHIPFESKAPEEQNSTRLFNSCFQFARIPSPLMDFNKCTEEWYHYKSVTRNIFSTAHIIALRQYKLHAYGTFSGQKITCKISSK